MVVIRPTASNYQGHTINMIPGLQKLPARTPLHNQPIVEPQLMNADHDDNSYARIG
jgi:hypothetical protein